MHGSARLAAALLGAGLVDTHRLAVAPAILGAGRRLPPHAGASVGVRLTRSEATGAGRCCSSTR